MNRTSSAPRAAPRRMLGERAEVRLVGDGDRDVAGRAPRARRSPSGTSRQPRFGAIETRPSVRRTTPTTATPTPTIDVARRSRRRGRASASSARSAAIVVDARRGRAGGRSGRCSRTSPPSPTTAAASESTAISRARTTARARIRAGRRGEGRPGVPSGAARSSSTRPAATSSPISAADGAAGQAGAGDELRARQRAADVELADDRAEVGAPDRLAALPDGRRGRDHHRVCVPLFQKAVTRLVHTTAAVSRSIAAQCRYHRRGPRSEDRGGASAVSRAALGDPVDGRHRPQEGHPRA